MNRRPAPTLPETLHPDQQLSVRQVAALVGFQKSKIYAMIGKGEFPEPTRYGPRHSRWRAGHVLDWLAGRHPTHASMAPPRTPWEEPRVKIVYDLLCDTDDVPPPEQHWEGWVARRVIDALYEPSEHLHFEGYVGSVEISLKDRCLHGRLLGVCDLITYEGKSVAQLEYAFRRAVGAYLKDRAKGQP